jgi:hypothetical protein
MLGACVGDLVVVCCGACITANVCCAHWRWHGNSVCVLTVTGCVYVVLCWWHLVGALVIIIIIIIINIIIIGCLFDAVLLMF